MFTFTDTGIKYENLGQAGGSEIVAQAIVPRTFNCTAVRVVAEKPAELMISDVRLANDTIITARMSLSIIQMFAEMVAKKLAAPLWKGCTIRWTLTNTNKGPLAYCIWLDGTWS
jgi:hypothetical protein